jgi:hypothetical protein
MKMDSIIEIINAISVMLMPAAIIIFVAGGITFYHKQKVYRIEPTGWLSVEEHQIPKDIKDYLGTNGREVKHFYKVQWGPHGKIWYDTDKTYITHWQAFPDVPNQ